jgi:cysteine desulfurase
MFATIPAPAISSLVFWVALPFSGIMSIYLDSNATTRVHPQVLEAMMPFLTGNWHDPSSLYASGRESRRAVGIAREQVAALIGAQPEEIVFTGSGSEASSAVIKSLAREIGRAHSKVLISTVEHSAVSRPVEAMAAVGFAVEKIGVHPDGRLDLAAFGAAVDPSCPGFISVMWANNETGTIQPLAEACHLAREAGWWVHTDAAHAVGRIPVRVDQIPVDYLSLSGHKFHATKGVGALFIRNGSAFEPMIRGSGQESGRRSGTENVDGIVGLGAAAALMQEELENGGPGRVARLRDRFEEALISELNEGPGAVLCLGSKEHRTGNVSRLSFSGCLASELLPALDAVGVQCSAGNQCLVGDGMPNQVLKAMGCSDEVALGSLRFSLSIFTTEDEIDEAVAKIAGVVKSARGVF